LGLSPVATTLNRPVRLTVAMTHPVQYYSPWFRYISNNCPEIELTVIYATVPTSEQQGVGFGVRFEWDSSPLEGYHSVRLRGPHSGDYLHSDKFLGLNVRGMARAIRDSRPDAVMVVGWYSVTLVRALAACRIHGYPAIYRGDTQLGVVRGRLRSALWSLKTRLMLSFFDVFLNVGRRNGEYLRHFGIPDSKILFSPHCVDNELFRRSAGREAEEEEKENKNGNGKGKGKGNGDEEADLEERTLVREGLGISADEFVVLFVGKLAARKRPMDVIAASAALGDDVTTVFVGAGSEEGRCRKEAEWLGARVVFAGFVNQSALGEIYRAADVCVLPSTSEETWGLVVNEALAAGTPCVVSDQVGCAADLIVPGVTGEVFPVGDVAACAASLSRIRDALTRGHDYTDDCRRIADRYSFERATEGLLRALRSVRQTPD
jgi:glycosyltransferase involved in cell wall biosynthesis